MATQATLTLELSARARVAKRSIERCASRVRFAVRGKKRLTPLSGEQIEQSLREGYLLVSGLIPDRTLRLAEEATWFSTGADRHEPRTWNRLGPRPQFPSDNRLLSCYTDELLAAAAQLVGDDPASYAKPRRTMTVNRIPLSRSEWRCLGAHVDYSLEATRHRSFPAPIRIGAMTYLTPVGPQGGGTVVWPGSHLKAAALARSDPQKYEFVSALSADVTTMDLGPFVEVEAARGDVLFHHPFCVHAGSDNLSDSPRLAINRKW